MNHIDQIIEEYKNSDFEKRLNYFLTFRSLRTEFIEIEKGNGYDTLFPEKSSKKRSGMFQKLHLTLLFH